MARWRLSESLGRQDWTAVAIDLAILILGVFLGIQASNWNDARKDRHTAAAYLDRISQDLAYDRDQLGFRESYWRAVAEDGDRALLFAEEGKLDRDQWSTLLDFYHAGQIWNYAPNNATYGEMLSAGRLDLISDRQIKSDLSKYYIGRRNQAQALFDVLPAYREHIRQAVPYRFQRYILEKCEGDIREAAPGRTCPPPPDRGDIAALNRRLASDSQLMGELRSWMTTLRYTRAVGSEDREAAARLLSQIAQSNR